MSSLNKDAFTIWGLDATVKHSGWPNEYSDAAKAFITGLDPVKNGEDGPDFWSWILENFIATLLPGTRHDYRSSRRETEALFYETLFLAKRETGEVVGTVSAVRDDRGRGKKYGLEGMWIGGFNITPDLQGRGLGSWLFDILLHNIQLSTFHENFQPFKVNLFTKNPKVKSLVERRGFTRNESIRMDSSDKDNSHYLRLIEHRTLKPLKAEDIAG